MSSHRLFHFRLNLDIFVPFLDGQNENVTLPPPYPIFSDRISVEVSHIHSNNEIYIQSSALNQRLYSLLEELTEFCTNGGVLFSPPIAGSLCAVFSVDQYFRATIEHVGDDETVLVRYVDYGNSERLPWANVKQLESKFLELDAFAIKMYLPTKFITDAKQTYEEIEKLTDDITLELKIFENYRGQWVINLESHGFSLLDRLRDKGLATAMNETEYREMVEEIEARPTTSVHETFTKTDAPTSTVTSASGDAEVAAPVVTAKGTEAYISHADNPNRFYLQLAANEDAVANFAQTLQIVAPSLSPLQEFRVGVTCIAQYSLDGQWYRAKILDTDGHVTSVLFTDYGNTDSITDNNLLRTYSESLNEFKEFALPCSLAVQPKGSSEWQQSACDKLMAISDNLLHFEFISEDAALNYVTLYDSGRDIANELIADDLAEALQVIRSGEQCFISHIDAIDDFYIQMNADSKALALIEEYLSVPSKFDLLAEYLPGTICIAPYDDGQYYRAEILTVSTEDAANTTINVRFIDYGNTHVVTELRSLPKNIAELPHLRHRCTLRKPDDIVDWSDAAEKQFKEITGEGKNILTVRLVKPDAKAIIELFIGERNISDELATLCTKCVRIDTSADDQEVTLKPANRLQCYITHVKSPIDFTVQLVEKLPKINEMIDSLKNPKLFEKSLKSDEITVGMIAIARFSEDRLYYRSEVCEILKDGGYHVRFIDYGNESKVKRLYALPVELQGEPMAVQCKLDVAIQDAEHQERLTKLLCVASEDDDTTFHEIEIVDDTTLPKGVKYYRQSMDLCAPIPSAEDTVNACLESMIDELVVE